MSRLNNIRADAAVNENTADSDGALVTKLSSALAPFLDPVSFSPDGNLFIIQYEDGRSAVWEWRPIVRRLAALGLGVKSYAISSRDQRMVVQYSTGDVYLLDLDWLRAMNGDSSKLPIDELVRLVCTKSLASPLWTPADQEELVTALNGQEAKVCR